MYTNLGLFVIRGLCSLLNLADDQQDTIGSSQKTDEQIAAENNLNKYNDCLVQAEKGRGLAYFIYMSIRVSVPMLFVIIYLYAFFSMKDSSKFVYFVARIIEIIEIIDIKISALLAIVLILVDIMAYNIEKKRYLSYFSEFNSSK
jgi:hypothetical protein